MERSQLQSPYAEVVVARSHLRSPFASIIDCPLAGFALNVSRCIAVYTKCDPCEPTSLSPQTQRLWRRPCAGLLATQRVVYASAAIGPAALCHRRRFSCTRPVDSFIHGLLAPRFPWSSAKALSVTALCSSAAFFSILRSDRSDMNARLPFTSYQSHARCRHYIPLKYHAAAQYETSPSQHSLNLEH